MTHGSREETGVRSPDCGGSDLVRADGGREVSRVDVSRTGVSGEDTGTANYRHSSGTAGGAGGTAATGSSRISSVGIRFHDNC